MSTDTSWNLNGRKRWELTAELETVAPLHIGCVEPVEHDDIVNKEGRKVEINGVLKGKDTLPIIPGSTIKGQLRQWLEEKGVDQAVLAAIFGKGYNQETEDQGCGGQAEFHDAPICHKLSGTQPYPYWKENRQTYVETSTAVDRHTKTALYQSLHYTEVVPPGVRFKFLITGVMKDEYVDILLAAIESFRTSDEQFCLGADTAAGKGHISLYGNIQAKYMDDKTICSWLETLPTQPTCDMAMTAADCLDNSAIRQRTQEIRENFLTQTQNLILDIKLQFDGPFIVNDPAKENNQDARQQVKFPLTDKSGNPILPGSSIRGALRSQAERIIRTLGGDCCDPADPCQAVYKIEDIENLCLACQIFGATGWKTTINIHNFTCDSVDTREKRQDFVAIDRFHGGGKDGALFATSHSERPLFTGKIEITQRMESGLEWGKGLLALVLRDLRERDITFGFGANKGYGYLESVGISDVKQLVPFIPGFRKQCLQHPGGHSCSEAQTPDSLNQDTLPVIANKEEPQQNCFLNPYNFIPLKRPDVTKWLPKDKLDKTSHHSHAFYRDATDEGKPIYYNGRITCRLKTETPTFIGSTSDNEHPATIYNYRLNNQIAIPATSLRGMISSLTEAAGNSAMRVLKNSMLSFRKNAGQESLRDVGMIVIRGKNRYIIPLVNTNKAIKLKNVYKNTAMNNFIENTNSWSLTHNEVYYLPSEHYYGVVPVQQYQTGMVPGILRILGKDEHRQNALENKKHELFIKVPCQYVDTENHTFNYSGFIDQTPNSSKLYIPENVWERYHELARERTLSQKNDPDLKDDEICSSTKWLPFHLKGSRRERDHSKNVCLLSVTNADLMYYRKKTGRNEAAEIAFSSIWRDRVEHNCIPSKVYNFFPPELLQFNKERQKISAAELLFGFTELNETDTDNTLAYAGKVRISAGIPLGNPDDDELLDPETVPLKVLSSPKLPSPALYFTSEDGSNSYISKQNLSKTLHKAKGRKYYLHAKKRRDDPAKVQKLGNNGHDSQSGEYPWVTLHPEDRPNLKVKIRPIREKKIFYFHIDFSNLTQWEMGLLCFALRPNENFRHKLGMGKPIGLGSVKIDIAALQTIDRTKRYTVDDVHAERFNQSNWANTDCREELTKAGCEINQTINPLEPELLKQIFVRTMDADIYHAIDLLGNPANVCYSVHYPQIRDHDIENENYQWFVANDSGSGSGINEIDAAKNVLKCLTKETDKLPELTRHEWRS